MIRVTQADHFEVAVSQKAWFVSDAIQTGYRLEHEVPYPGRSLLARLLSSRFLMKAIPERTSATIAAAEGRHLIEVHLENGEVALSKMNRVVGFVEAKLGGVDISASLIAYTLGQTILHRVNGPGTVYYQSSSRSVELITCSTVGNRSFDAASIVCFSTDTHFVLTSGQSFMSLVFGTWQLELREGWVVLDLGNKTASGNVFFRLLRRLYWPFG